MKADLHVHTYYSSCSKAKINDILKSAQRKGMDVIAITDHNTIRGALEAKRVNPYTDLRIIIGVEKKCEYGELLIYNVKKEIVSKKFADILKDAKKQNCFVFIAHPFDFFRFTTKWSNFEENVLGSVDGIEVFNGRNAFNYKSKSLYEKSGLKGVAGSDSHFPEEIGNAYVEYKNDLWNEILSRKAEFRIKNMFINKIKYLLKSFFNKWFLRKKL
ncbi:phosphatase YcdX [Candidatus Tiddalikarchaeum anstoanum]|nr:phosphatase YcdX [Candidatus Tiddalikarchaeum anstoanum]